MALFRDHSGERTEMPTALRLEEARRQGQVARSADVVSVALLVAAAAALAVCGAGLTESLRAMLANSLGDAGEQGGSLTGGLKLGGVLWAAAPIVAAPLLAALAAGLVQTGLLFTPAPLRPDLGRLSPAAGLRRVFSGRSLVAVVFAAAKIAAVVVVSWYVIAVALGRIVTLVAARPEAALGETGAMMLRLAVRLLAALAVLAALDWLYQRHRLREELKITRRELLDDLRRMEGGAHSARRRRRAAQELAGARGMGEIARATVVVAGRFGPAAALRYEQGMAAPQITAIGRGTGAAHIRRAAMRANVPVVGDRRLAGAIARDCREEQDVPPHLYEDAAKAVAAARTQRGKPGRGGSKA